MFFDAWTSFHNFISINSDTENSPQTQSNLNQISTSQKKLHLFVFLCFCILCFHKDSFQWPRNFSLSSARGMSRDWKSSSAVGRWFKLKQPITLNVPLFRGSYHKCQRYSLMAKYLRLKSFPRMQASSIQSVLFLPVIFNCPRDSFL